MKQLRREWPLPVAVATAASFFLHGERWFAALEQPAWFALLSTWLFLSILVAAFAAVRHAENLAHSLGEPGGTLILTLAIIGIEVMLIASVMYVGAGSATLARDAMFAVIMIVLNGMVGLCLIVGGLRYHEQEYNLHGANAFLAVIIPMAVLTLVLPSFTTSSAGATYSPAQAAFLSVMSIALYGVFLAIQTVRHRAYFLAPETGGSAFVAAPGDPEAHSVSIGRETLWLLAYLLPLLYLCKQIAEPIDHGIAELRAPAALAGLLVSILVLSPESLSAVRAALANQLQRSVNLLLGSVLASISLTVPAVIAVGYLTGQPIVLGLDPANTTLLVLTLGLSTLTFTSVRTNVLLGAVHLLIFLAYLMLIFER